MNLKTLLSYRCFPVPMLLLVKVEEEVQVAAIDIGLLYRRWGLMGKSAMLRLGKEELVRGLKGCGVGGMSRLRVGEAADEAAGEATSSKRCNVQGDEKVGAAAC